MNRLYLFFVLVFLFACKKEEPKEPIDLGPKATTFRINIEGQDSIVINNAECDFDDHITQWQYNGGHPGGWDLHSSIHNKLTDSTENFILIDLFLIPEPYTIYDYDNLSEILAKCYNTKNKGELRIKIGLDINGNRYNNELEDTDPTTPPYKISDSLYYEIKEYDMHYHSQCLDRDLIYIKLEMQGKLYQYDWWTKIDSIRINKTEMNLLFLRH